MTNEYIDLKCPFCKRSRMLSAFAQSKSFLAVYNIAPILPGHSLVVPKWHVGSIMDLGDAEISELMLFSRQVVKVLLKEFNASSFNYTIQEGKEAGQTVPHLHLHLIPRRLDDLPRPGDWYPVLRARESKMIDSELRPRLSRADLKEVVSRIRLRVADEAPLINLGKHNQ